MLGNDYSKKRRLFLRTHLWHHRKHWLPLKGMSLSPDGSLHLSATKIPLRPAPNRGRALTFRRVSFRLCFSLPTRPAGGWSGWPKTPRPLEERLTLFWHRHFATGGQKVFSPGLMMQQNQTLRTHAGGKFEDLLRAVLFDPAMAQYLDLADNTKDQPNEKLRPRTLGALYSREGTLF